MWATHSGDRGGHSAGSVCTVDKGMIIDGIAAGNDCVRID